MNTSSHSLISRTDTGNAVALTLLGLAVAILAGVAVLYIIGKNAPQSGMPIVEEDTEGVQQQETQVASNPRGGWNLYENEMYGFSFSFPPGWIVATGTERGVPIITAYDARRVADLAGGEEYDVHTIDLRVSIYPEGLPGGGEGEQTAPSKNTVLVAGSQSVDYVLDTGVPWATKTTFEQYPDSWAPYGYVYARSPIEGQKISYTRGDTVISADDFDPYAGDTMVLSGYVDALSWEVMSLVLTSFSFTDVPRMGEGAALDPIIVTTPGPGDVVSNPLLVEGEALGSWYFEASFPVRLVTASGDVLASVPASALSDWMTEGYVPFSVSIVFSVPPFATSGRLVLTKDNPSGLPEHDAFIEIPVMFQTAE